MRILLVEDEKKIASFIKRGLREENYVVDIANEGDKGFFLASVNPYDLIMLDIMLPQKDGLSICRDLRRNTSGLQLGALFEPLLCCLQTGR